MSSSKLHAIWMAIGGLLPMTLIRSAHTRTALRWLGAVLLLFVGADHFYEYAARDYSVIPTIGALFLLNFVSATIVGLALLAPLERLSQRFGMVALAFAAASGAAIAATSLLALLVSEQTALFGFMEFNYRPEIVVAIASEAAAMLVLGTVTLLAVGAWRAAVHPATRRAAGFGPASIADQAPGAQATRPDPVALRSPAGRVDVDQKYDAA